MNRTPSLSLNFRTLLRTAVRLSLRASKTGSISFVEYRNPYALLSTGPLACTLKSTCNLGISAVSRQRNSDRRLAFPETTAGKQHCGCALVTFQVGTQNCRPWGSRGASLSFPLVLKAGLASGWESTLRGKKNSTTSSYSTTCLPHLEWFFGIS